MQFKMAGQQRNVRFRGQSDATTNSKGRNIAARNSDKKASDIKYGIPHALLIFTFIAAFSYAVFASETFLPTSKSISSPDHEFSGDRARKHLVDITNLGARPTGSYENDIKAVKVIVEGISKIKTNAKEGFEMEIDVQTTSGSLAFVREGLIPIGYTTAYNNITNILVKVTSKKSKSSSFILVNAHFDTVMNTEGASDDTVSCAVMMEMLQAFSRSNPDEMKHGLIFLFNGAEEGPLAGSHGFIKEHKWKELPKVIINLEAAGSGMLANHIQRQFEKALIWTFGNSYL